MIDNNRELIFSNEQSEIYRHPDGTYQEHYYNHFSEDIWYRPGNFGENARTMPDGVIVTEVCCCCGSPVLPDNTCACV